MILLKRIMMKRAVMSAAALAFAGGMTLTAPAQAAYPDHPIEMLCVTGPSSGAAIWCRLMAQIVGKELGQPIEVLYKGGGGGNTAAEYAANKPADGYTWLHRNTSYAGYMNMPTFKPDPDQFEVVVHMTKFLYAIGVPADSKYNTFQELIEDMKANPGKISVAANKPGSVHHRHLINLFNAYDVKWNYVPYKGSGGAMKDVLGGHVPVGIMPTGIWEPQVAANAGRTLVLLNDEAYPGIDAPIPKDFGQDYAFTHQVQGFFVKQGTPDDVRQVMADAFKKASESQEYKDWIANTTGAISVFDDDGPALTKQFHDARKETGVFLREAGLIK